MTRTFPRRELYVILCGAGVAAALIGVFFGECAIAGRVYYGGDIARLYLPQRVGLAQALRQGHVLWWVADLGAGYPLLAEGEAGVLYPPNWLTYLLLPPATGLTVSIIGHVVWAALGLYAWGRAIGLSRPASLLLALVPTVGGFGAQHVGHVSMLSVAAWHPWMLFATTRLWTASTRRRRLAWSAALCGATALQFLAGHPQTSLLVGVMTAAYALRLAVTRYHEARWRPAATWGLAVLAGAALAAPQLVPAAQLASLSQRGGGLDATFFTSFSLHPLAMVTFAAPFALGNPYPAGSVELLPYVGLLPLMLAAVGLCHGKRPDRWLYAALCAVGLVLAFGKWNPMYRFLANVPIVNLFRVPARYLYWTQLGLGLLAGAGLDALRRPLAGEPARGTALACVVAVVSAAVARMAVSLGPDAETLIRAWRWLPLVWAAAGLVLLATASRARRVWWALAVLVVLGADLWAYRAVLDRTFNQTTSREQTERSPVVIGILDEDAGGEPYRIYTKEEILPALSVMEASLYPNMSLGRGVASAGLYMPLVPWTYYNYLNNLTAERLDRLNVRYYLIPQLLPVDAERELYDVSNPFAGFPLAEWVSIPDGQWSALEVESYVSHAADLQDGTVAALVRLQGGVSTVELPLRVGIETAEWAYERSDVLAAVRHARATVATTWPASSGFPPESHIGHTYLARWSLEPSFDARGLRIDAVVPPAYVRIERVRMLSSNSEPLLLGKVAGRGDHTIIYRSEDVMVYRNEDALPRAYALPASQVQVFPGRLVLPAGLARNLAGTVQIVRYDDARVDLRAVVPEPAFLVLADLAYPGWAATVDNERVEVLVADGVFRAVPIGPGDHSVVFRYRFWAGR